MKKLIFAYIVSIFFYFPAQADYTAHDPILIENIHATAEDPYIIEGYEISNPDGNCIEVKNSEHVIIRNNFLHDCQWHETENMENGFAVLVGDSEDITIENNILEDNQLGLAVYQSQRVDVIENDIQDTNLKYSLYFERVDDGEIAENYLEDNGIPEWFWQPGHRIIGIWVARSSGIDIYDNTVIRSTSDGIAATGQIYGPSFTSEETDWTDVSRNIRIFDNTILDNMEQGIWLVRGRDIEVFNNIIRTGCFTHGTAISLEFNVDDSEFYNNKIAPCLIDIPAGASASHNNYFHDNVVFDWRGNEIFFTSGPEDEGDQIKAEWSGITLTPSSDNRVENNKFFYIEGELADEMRSKLDYAESNETYEAKGWFSCEVREGELDEDCVEEERAKGDQGVEKELLVYDLLMSNFYDYTVITESPFPDLNIDELNGQAAAELYKREIIGGYPDGEFKGKQAINRAETAKLLLLASNKEISNTENNTLFSDVNNDEWYSPYVITSVNNGIIDGYPDGTFKPSATINTAEFLKMISRAFSLEENMNYNYLDIPGSAWYRPYAGIAERYELFPDRQNYLNPGQLLTRNEVAIAIYQLLENQD